MHCLALASNMGVGAEHVEQLVEFPSTKGVLKGQVVTLWAVSTLNKLR